MYFDFIQIFQKVFPHIPGGCRYQESAGHRVLDNCYRRVRDTCFKLFVFLKNELFQIVQKTFLKQTTRDTIINYF